MHIEHIAIWTRDIERLRGFFETYFGAQAGAKYHNPATGFESYFLTFDSGTRLEVMYKASIPASQNDPLTQATGMTHLAFALGTEHAVNALTERLGADGFRVLDGPRRTGDGYYESVVLDPDGNRIEITV